MASIAALLLLPVAQHTCNSVVMPVDDPGGQCDIGD